MLEVCLFDVTPCSVRLHCIDNNIEMRRYVHDHRYVITYIKTKEIQIKNTCNNIMNFSVTLAILFDFFLNQSHYI